MQWGKHWLSTCEAGITEIEQREKWARSDLSPQGTHHLVKEPGEKMKAAKQTEENLK